MPAREQDHSSQRHRTQSTKTTAKAPQHRPQPGPSRNADAQRAEQKEGDSTDEDAEEAEAEEEEEEEEDVRQRTSLSLANNPLPRLDALIETLAQFKNLHRLDLSSIQPSEHNLDGLASLFWLIKSARKSGSEGFKKKLTWLNVSGNPALGKTGAEAWAGLETLEQLFVLNASHSALSLIPPPLPAFSFLKALVLSHNDLSSLPSNFPYLPSLNTLVLSNNVLSTLPKTLPASLPSLKKLSASHNKLANGSNALPDFSLCAHLREVRLANNEGLESLPAHLAAWGKGADGRAPGLEYLDLGGCGLETWGSVQPLMKAQAAGDTRVTSREEAMAHRKTKGLANLRLEGNPVAKQPDYREKILETFPTLRILDNERVQPKACPLASAAAARGKDVQRGSAAQENSVVAKSAHTAKGDRPLIPSRSAERRTMRERETDTDTDRKPGKPSNRAQRTERNDAKKIAAFKERKSTGEDSSSTYRKGKNSDPSPQEDGDEAGRPESSGAANSVEDASGRKRKRGGRGAKSKSNREPGNASEQERNMAEAPNSSKSEGNSRRTQLSRALGAEDVRARQRADPPPDEEPGVASDEDATAAMSMPKRGKRGGRGARKRGVDTLGIDGDEHDDVPEAARADAMDQERRPKKKARLQEKSSPAPAASKGKAKVKETKVHKPWDYDESKESTPRSTPAQAASHSKQTEPAPLQPATQKVAVKDTEPSSKEGRGKTSVVNIVQVKRPQRSGRTPSSVGPPATSGGLGVAAGLSWGEGVGVGWGEGGSAWD